MKDWLTRCNKLEGLNFNAELRIKGGCKGASKGYFPVGLEKLKKENNCYVTFMSNFGKSLPSSSSNAIFFTLAID